MWDSHILSSILPFLHNPVSSAGSDGEYNGPADITFEDMYRAFSHLSQYEHQDDLYWQLGRGTWNYINQPMSDHTYGNNSGRPPFSASHLLVSWGVSPISPSPRSDEFYPWW